MKKNISILTLVTCIIVLLILCCSCTKIESLTGKWIDDRTEAIVEYTADGYYYEYANESFTTDKTRYTVKNGKIYYYIDGEDARDGFGVDYEINSEGNLIIAGEIEYRPLRKPQEDDAK